MLASQRFAGLARAMLGGVLPLPGTTWQTGAGVGTDQQGPQNSVIRAPIDMHPMSATASCGQEIRRPLQVKDAARWFVQELQSREIVGERTWRALWDCYVWFCDEAEIVPLPVGMKSRFAQELANLCQRGQVRISEGGKLRRLTTYDVPDAQPAYLRAAA